MLYSEKRYDISEQILRTILRTNNQNQVESRREKKRIEKESIISKSMLTIHEKLKLKIKRKLLKLKEIKF